MPYPEYVRTRQVTVGGVLTVEGAEPLGLTAVVTSSRGLVWGATGVRYESSPRTVVATAGTEAVLELPVTDQDGWRDAATGAVIDMATPGAHSHTYTVKVTFKDAAGKTVGSTGRTFGPFVLPEGDGSPVDLDTLVPVGTTAGPMVSIPDSWGPLVERAETVFATVGQPGGVAPLDEDGLVPAEHLPENSGGGGGGITPEELDELLTETEVLHAVARTGSYDDLTDKPTIPAPVEGIGDVAGLQNALDDKLDASEVSADLTGPTDTSVVRRVEGRIKAETAEDGDDVVNLAQLDAAVDSLADVAASGSYNDLVDRPSIPTVPSTLPPTDGSVSPAKIASGYVLPTSTKAAAYDLAAAGGRIPPVYAVSAEAWPGGDGTGGRDDVLAAIGLPTSYDGPLEWDGATYMTTDTWVEPAGAEDTDRRVVRPA